MRRRRPEPAPRAQDRWIVPYADFVTLLFAFFCTLYAISSLDARQARAAREGLESAFDGRAAARSAAGPEAAFREMARPPAPAPPVDSLDDADETVPDPVPEFGADTAAASAPPVEPGSLEDLRWRLLDRLARHITAGQVEVTSDRRGLVVSIPEAGSFAPGSAEPSDRLKALVGEIAEPILELATFVRIEGHTDDVPIRTSRYASNWELSTARATGLVAYLIQQFGIDPGRVAAAGYAEFHPRAPNDTAASRARNRRVDIVVLSPDTMRTEEPPMD